MLQAAVGMCLRVADTRANLVLTPVFIFN
jgi:hypothetical protein